MFTETAQSPDLVVVVEATPAVEVRDPVTTAARPVTFRETALLEVAEVETADTKRLICV